MIYLFVVNGQNKSLLNDYSQIMLDQYYNFVTDYTNLPEFDKFINSWVRHSLVNVLNGRSATVQLNKTKFMQSYRNSGWRHNFQLNSSNGN